MYTAKIVVSLAQDSELDDLLEAIDYLTSALRKNGQVCGAEYPIAQLANEINVFAMLPDADALEPQHHNQYVVSAIDRIQALAHAIRFELLGHVPASAEPCVCIARSSYVLYTTYLLLESPLRCGDCFAPVPLYRIPATYDDEYYNIIHWQSDYQSCDRLYMNSRTAVRSALWQLSRVNSALSQAGIELCRIITQQTGIPSYYHLFHPTERPVPNCPQCATHWQLDQVWHDMIEYRCDVCLLVASNQ